MRTFAQTQKTKPAECVVKAGSTFSRQPSQVHSILQPQRMTGNQAGTPLLSADRLEAKLRISELGDAYEQEADRVAEHVLAAPAHSAISSAPPRIQSFTGQSAGQAAASVDRVLASPGRPLDPGLQQDMEQRFGHDFSRVLVHEDDRAAEWARALNALAYTVGRHVAFGAGQFAPGTAAGRRLLAHELTHVMQAATAENVVRRQTAAGGKETTLSPMGGYQYLWSTGPPNKPPALLDTAAIAERIDVVKAIFNAARLALPNHPMITFLDDFMNGRLDPLVISDLDPKKDATQILEDLSRMPEVQTAFMNLAQEGLALRVGETRDCSRTLGEQSLFQQFQYAVGFPSEVYDNTTRAGLGSFSGTATISQVEDGFAVVTFEIDNTLTFESLTRAAPAFGGYSEGNSFIPNIPGWSKNLHAEFKMVIKLPRTIEAPTFKD